MTIVNQQSSIDNYHDEDASHHTSDLETQDPTSCRQRGDPRFPAGAGERSAAPPSAAPASESVRASGPFRDRRFSGQALTLDLVDLPLVDFFRLMAEEGGINVVIDPEVKGTITIRVVKLPWDQIFEAVLLNNNLDKRVEGNLVRIATKTTLHEEARQRRVAENG